MANIPVERTERTGGFPWWGWLLGLLLLIGLIWLLSSAFRGDDRTPVTTTDTTAVAPGPVTQQDTGVLTEPRVLADAPDPRLYAGREVRLANLRVEVAYSDSVFYAVPEGAPVNRRFFVVVGNPATPGIGGPATLDVGDAVTVHGRLEEPARNELERWDVAADERDRLIRLEDYYIRATRVDRGVAGTRAPATGTTGTTTAPGATGTGTAPGTAPGTATPSTTPPPP
jgi:hypothetical protein